MTKDEDQRRTREWVENWAKVGPKLEALRRRELRAMTYEQRIQAIESVLHLGALLRKPRTTSGLVEQQRLFRKARR
ncbi:MAG: hypothetical protein ACYSWU_17295 [Planctomycetota bacterium]|jgi:hypothetical protein